MITINDVAKLVGVSHTAVSGVLNGRPVRVGEETRQRILDAAKSLGYRTNRAAQQLVTGRYGTIGLCFEKADKHFFANSIANQLIAGVGYAASENGLYLLFAPTQPDDKFTQTIGSLPTHGVDGGIVIGPVPRTEIAISAIDNCDIPLVCIDAYRGFASASTIDTDNMSGMKMGVEYLISKGHTKMAYIGFPPKFQCLMDRMQGFQEALEGVGLSVEDQMVHDLVIGDEVAWVVRQFVSMVNRPTALIFAEGAIGKVALDELVRLGLRVPDDIAVLVYDEVPAWHPLAESAIVIRNDPYKMGRAAGDLLLKLISGECSGPVSVRMSAELITPTI